nr:MAG TPA: hypothetical protein [Caudoviricetes sp.]
MFDHAGGGCVICTISSQSYNNSVQQAQHHTLYRQRRAVKGFGPDEDGHRDDIGQQLGVDVLEGGLLQKLGDDGDHHDCTGISTKGSPSYKFVHIQAPFFCSRLVTLLLRDFVCSSKMGILSAKPLCRLTSLVSSSSFSLVTARSISALLSRSMLLLLLVITTAVTEAMPVIIATITLASMLHLHKIVSDKLMREVLQHNGPGFIQTLAEVGFTVLRVKVILAVLVFHTPRCLDGVINSTGRTDIDDYPQSRNSRRFPVCLRGVSLQTFVYLAIVSSAVTHRILGISFPW